MKMTFKHGVENLLIYLTNIKKKKLLNEIQGT